MYEYRLPFLALFLEISALPLGICSLIGVERGKACNNGLYILLNCASTFPSKWKIWFVLLTSGGRCPLLQGREVRPLGGAGPAVAASRSAAHVGHCWPAVFYSRSLVFVQVHCRHSRVLLTGQNNDSKKPSWEDQGDIFISVEVYIQSNPDHGRVTFEWIQILHGTHSYSSFKDSMGKCSVSQCVT